MSQSGLLSEDEIRNYINESFGLKLDRDAFMKPSKDVVTDIYTRFLDETAFNWRKPRSEDFEPNLKAQMVGWIKTMLKEYSVPNDFIFNMGDLIMPTRKRTTAFLNVLIYIKVQFEDSKAEWLEWKKIHASKQDEVERIKSELYSQQIVRDKLAFKKGTSQNIDELAKALEEKRQRFEVAKEKCDALGEEAKVVKTRIKALNEEREKKQIGLDKKMKTIDELSATLQILNEGRKLPQRIADLESDLKTQTERLKAKRDELQAKKRKIPEIDKLIILVNSNRDAIVRETDYATKLFQNLKIEKEAMETRIEQARNIQTNWQVEEESLQEQLTKAEKARSKMRIQFSIKQEQAKLDLAKKEEQRKERAQQFEARIARIQQETESIKKERAEIKSKQEETSEQCQMYIAKANSQLEAMQKRREDSYKASQESIATIMRCRTRLNELIDPPKEISISKPEEVSLCKQRESELPADRTYISKPEGVSMSKPDGISMSKPRETELPADRTYISKPEGVSMSKPEGVSMSKPEGVSMSKPEGVSMSKPEGISMSKPRESELPADRTYIKESAFQK